MIRAMLMDEAEMLVLEDFSENKVVGINRKLVANLIERYRGLVTYAEDLEEQLDDVERQLDAK